MTTPHADRDHSEQPVDLLAALQRSIDQAREARQPGTSRTDAARETPSIVGMVDRLGRPATIYTPPEELRRDPNRWPTPVEFVTEWGEHSTERRLQLAERILGDAQEVERLRRWKAEATEVIAGLQHLGHVLGLRLGEQVTGQAGIEAASRLSARAASAEAKVARVHEVVDGKAGGFAQAVRAALVEPERKGCGCSTHPDRHLKTTDGDPYGCYCDCSDTGRDDCEHADARP